jgi:hypothetical protein
MLREEKKEISDTHAGHERREMLRYKKKKINDE